MTKWVINNYFKPGEGRESFQVCGRIYAPDNFFTKNDGKKEEMIQCYFLCFASKFSFEGVSKDFCLENFV